MTLLGEGTDRVLTIDPHGSSEPYLRECWRYRHVVWFLARRDLVIRYRASVLGLGWIWLRPLLAALVFTLIFSRIAHLPGGGFPYPVLVLAGMVPWQFVANVINESGLSLSNNVSLITKIWLPRILLPSSTLVLNSVDMLVNALLVGLAMCWYHLVPSWRVVLAPLMLLPVEVLGLGLGLLTAAVMVRYRDVRNIVTMLLQFGMLLSPVAYTTHAAPATWQHWLWLNPLVLPIEGLRWCLLPGYLPPQPQAVALSLATTALVLVVGWRYFRLAEGRFADVI